VQITANVNPFAVLRNDKGLFSAMQSNGSLSTSLKMEHQI